MSVTVHPPTSGTRSSGAGFVGYLLTAALVSFGALAVFTPLILLAVPGLALGTVLLVRRHTGADLLGLVSGLCAVPFWLAWTNRGGPTYDCAGGSGDTCPDLSSPWPYAAVGVVLLVAGLIGYVLLGRRRAATR
jgi:hypothetical protein